MPTSLFVLCLLCYLASLIFLLLFASRNNKF